MNFDISSEKVSFELYGKRAEYDKTPFALFQLREAFEVKIKQDVEKLRANRTNGQPVKTTQGYNAQGQQETSWKVCPWAWDNVDEVKAFMSGIGGFVSKILTTYGVKINPNWNHISAPWVGRVNEIGEVLGKALGDSFTCAAQNVANTYQRAYNEELSRDYGLSFGILSSSLTAHLVYAAQSAAKEQKDKERAANFASEVAGNPMEKILIAAYETIYPLYMNSAEPALIKVLGEYYSYVVSLLAKELGYNYDDIENQYSLEDSLAILDHRDIDKETIFEALSKNPSNGVVIGYATQHDFLDDELCQYGHKASPLFIDRLKNWAIAKLSEIYNAGKLFNKPLINDDNRTIVVGLMRFFKTKHSDLFECEDWQDILAGAFFPVVGKHLTDFTELAITIASPLDFDQKARIGKQFKFSNETKQTFVFLHNEMFFSGAKTTASFLDLKSPVSITAFDRKVKELNERLAVRTKELAEQAEIQRKQAERKRLAKKKKSSIIAIVAGCFFIPIGIVLFAIESFFLGFVEIAVGIGGLIFGIKQLNEYRDEFKISEKEAYEQKERKKQDFWAKNKTKVIIITTLSLATIIFFILLPTVIIPNGKYNDAVELMNDGKYDTAIQAFESLDGYRDSDTQIKECKYLSAVEDQKAKDYDAAYATFVELDKYSDSSSKALSCAIEAAEYAMSKKQYDKAVEWYNLANKTDEVKNAKYQYVQSHKNATDTTTYQYLRDLKWASYKDAESIYNQLYKIHLEYVINDSPTDVTTHKTNFKYVSSYYGGAIYIHVRLTGGYPGQTTWVETDGWHLDSELVKCNGGWYTLTDDMWLTYGHESSDTTITIKVNGTTISEECTITVYK